MIFSKPSIAVIMLVLALLTSPVLTADALASEEQIKRLIADRLSSQAARLGEQIAAGAPLRAVLAKGSKVGIQAIVNERARLGDPYARLLKSAVDANQPIDFSGGILKGWTPYKKKVDCLISYVDKLARRNARIIQNTATRIKRADGKAASNILLNMRKRVSQPIKNQDLPKICISLADARFFAVPGTPLSTDWNAKCYRTEQEHGGQIKLTDPTVAALLYNAGTSGKKAFCSGTLIAPNVVLTAAHCFCLTAAKQRRGIFYRTSRSCQSGSYVRKGIRVRTIDPRNHQVFFQHAGLFKIRKVIIQPKFNWTGTLPRADLALVILDKPVRKFAATPINTIARVRPGTIADGSGFGFYRPIGRNGVPKQTLEFVKQTGLKFSGPIRTGRCRYGGAGRDLICWTHLRRFAGRALGATCKGDSGGPLFASHKGRNYLVGVTSAGGSRCAPGSRSYNTALYPHRRWIQTVVKANQPRGFKPLNLANTRQVKCIFCPLCQKNLLVAGDTTGDKTSGDIVIRPRSARRLRVSSNCSDGLGKPLLTLMLTKMGGGVTAGCQSSSRSGFQSCDVSVRTGERWRVTLDGAQTRVCQIMATTSAN